MIPVYRPYFPKGSLDYAHHALDSTWVSSKGVYLEKVKEILADEWGTTHIILTNSGTAANHLCAIALKKKFPKRVAVICPNNVYVAAWNPFLIEGYRLAPIDADIETWNFNIDKLKGAGWPHAFLIVHNLGNPVDVHLLKARYPDVPIIEDACEGYGGMYRNLPVGMMSDAFSMSFFGNKNVTSGEGGAFATYDPDMYEAAFEYWGQGMTMNPDRRFIHNSQGHNYRMTNVEAGILYGQLQLKDEILEKKEALFSRYRELLGDLETVHFQKVEQDCKHSNWMFGIRIEKSEYTMAKRHFDMYEIETRPMFYPITEQKYMKDIRCETDVAEKLSRECVVLPSYPGMTETEQDYVVEAVRRYVQELSVL